MKFSRKKRKEMKQKPMPKLILKVQKEQRKSKKDIKRKSVFTLNRRLIFI